MEFAFKLSIHGQHPGTDFRDLVDLAVFAEEVGFDGVYVIDHLLLPGSRLSGYTNAPADQPYFLDAWVALAAIAQATHRVKVGPQVTPIGLRHPALVARAAATLDQVSGGRLLLQLGAGHQRVEYASYGFEFPTLDDRITRLREGIEVIRALWETDGPASYRGEHYLLDEVPFFPKPVQERPPIWLGGASARILDLVAELADGWSPAAPQGKGITPAVFGDALRSIRSRVTDGRHVTGGALFYTVVDDDPARVEAALSILRRRADWADYTVDDFRDRAIALAGSADTVADAIGEYAKQGLEHISLAVVPIDDHELTRATLRRLGEDVMGRFR
ncbi:LLM class flavin-dependent oxidoreductase [Jiangella mangrovi]|uniref:Putative F420-dependent oxidoreductase n=1 Tax=Jiangella mangrovi TaxID=1524084 RepID=A0A7W9LNB0_9ACTN|nr:putative F420-dependent oxidoreductase [Jiangella mangrovi]